MYRTVFWTLWERVRVGWFGRMALKHVYYHMWNESPVQFQCRIQDAWGWCTGMTQRDGMGREVGEGSRNIFEFSTCYHVTLTNQGLCFLTCKMGVLCLLSMICESAPQMRGCCFFQRDKYPSLFWVFRPWGRGGIRVTLVVSVTWGELV